VFIVLSLLSPFDLQLELSQFVKTTRKSQGYSVKAFSEKTGVPDSTIRQFEKTGEISLRQFLMIYSEVGKLTDIKQLTQKAQMPSSLDEVINHA
jgi:transcriptional regulator with XRE-family HTH domain